MERKIISIFLIGIFLSAGILITPAEQTNKNTQEENDYITKSTLYEENNVYIGETRTVYEPEAFTGSSNADVVNMSVEWMVNPGDEEAHGTLGMEIFDFNFAEENMNPLPFPLTTTTVCDYEFTVFDGPSSGDGELTSGHNSFMGGGLKYKEMAHPFDVKTKNQNSRTLAFQMNAKTQTYIPALRMTIENEIGSISKLGEMIIDFITPAEKQKKLQNDNPLPTTKVGIPELDLGDIEIYTSDENIPECEIYPNLYEDPFGINESEIIDISAYLDFEISIVEKNFPPILKFLPCQLNIKIRAFSWNTNQQYRQLPDAKSEFSRSITGTLIEEGTIPISFTLDTSEYPSGTRFLITYNLIVPGLFGKLLDGESQKIIIHWEPN